MVVVVLEYRREEEMKRRWGGWVDPTCCLLLVGVQVQVQYCCVGLFPKKQLLEHDHLTPYRSTRE